MQSRDGIVIWPVYFDSTRTRGEGRRLPKNLCIPSPNIGIIEGALKKLGLNYEVFPESAYPRTPWIKSGFIIVRKTGRSKSQILREIARELVKSKV
ncbi:MAG: signal recognition particle subunit SRP19/SEC65 family protein [Candidatus Bathyarchaeia archaeon]|nr:signal recognition particle protein Srp19 [Candidatus Bathyarchaeota archaeon]